MASVISVNETHIDKQLFPVLLHSHEGQSSVQQMTMSRQRLWCLQMHIPQSIVSLLTLFIAYLPLLFLFSPCGKKKGERARRGRQRQEKEQREKGKERERERQH